MNEDLKRIKKKYGEKMAHFCRELFPTLLDQEGVLSSLMENKFYPNKSLYDDIVNEHKEAEFKSYIYSFFDVEEEKIVVNKTPFELLDEAGYVLTQCNSEEEINAFKKYYASGEELCTFRGGRLGRCHVFFAVKKDVDKIKRKDFKRPDRQDEYGTSVLSIQFTRGKVNTVSIKNRYNHMVNNPDSTFNNNLDKIIPGLRDSFEREYGFNINYDGPGKFELKNYTKIYNGKFYKYNSEDDNIYSCSNNIYIKDFYPNQLDERYILIDRYVIDFKEKEIISLYNLTIPDNPNAFRAMDEYGRYIEPPMYRKYEDDFCTKNLDDIVVNKEGKNRRIDLIRNNEVIATIIINKDNSIIEYTNTELEEIDDSFMKMCYNVRKINLPNVTVIGKNFLEKNINLEEANIPELMYVGACFLANCKVKKLDFPKLKIVTDNCFTELHELEEVNLPSLESADAYAFYNCSILKKISLPLLKVVDNNAFNNCHSLEEIDLPMLERAERSFFTGHSNVKEISLPKLRRAGDDFLSLNSSIKKASFENLIEVGNEFMGDAIHLNELNVPKLQIIESRFLRECLTIKELDLPSVEEIGYSFMAACPSLEVLNAPKLKKVGYRFLMHDPNIKTINAPFLYMMGKDSLLRNDKLREEMEKQIHERGMENVQAQSRRKK